MNSLPVFTEKTREFCLYAGIAGLLFSLISIVHVFAAAAQFNWFILVLVAPNVSAAVSFILLVKASRHLFILLIITLVLFILYFLLVFFLLTNLVIIYSPSTLLLFLFTLAVLIYGYITDLPGKLQEHYVKQREDEAYWNNKL